MTRIERLGPDPQWTDIIDYALRRLDGEGTLYDIYHHVEKMALKHEKIHEKIYMPFDYRDSIRCCIARNSGGENPKFTKTGRGRYKLNGYTPPEKIEAGDVRIMNVLENNAWIEREEEDE